MEQSEEQVKKIICQSDLEAFCCNKSLCKEVVAHRNGYRTFNKPILFVGSCWFAYRNMVGWAFIYDWVLVVGNVLVTIMGILFDWTTGLLIGKVILFVANAIFWGYISIPLYTKNIEKVFSERALFNRVDEQNEVIENSLRKEGKPSVIRAVVYRVLVNMFFTTIACLLHLCLWKTGGTAV